LAMAAVSFHLMHGFQSAFQSLGLRASNLVKPVKVAGYLFAVIIPLLFASIPVFIHLTY